MEEEIKQEYNKNKKKKILLIIIPILLLLIALAVALPLLLIKNDKKIVDIVFYQSSIFTIGQDLSNHVMIVTYEDDSTEQITFGDLTISDEDKASLSTVGEKVITITYKDFTKELDFLIVWNEFTDQEKQSMQVSDAFFEFDGNTQSVYLSSLPEGASAVYSVDNQDNFQPTYNVSEIGEYTIYVKVSKQNYLDYDFSFKISIVDTSANIDGFTKEEENLFTYRADSSLKTFDITNMVILADENAKYKIYSDKDLSQEVQANALPLNAGGGTSVFYLQVYFESNSLSRIYRIEISQAYSYQVNFYFKDEVIKNIKVEENKTVSAPDFSREGYTISGWKVNDETVSFPLTINEDTDIYADYSLVDYNLSFTLNGGQIITSKTTYTIEDEDFTLPLPTKEGYDFLGWSGSDIEGMTLDVTIEKGSTGNREYTANWQIKTFTVNIPENQDVYTLTYDKLTVEYGEDFVFEVDLTDAYSQSTIVVKANGEELTLQGEYYTISNITQNINVTIEGATINTYIIRWLNHDGSVLETDENVEYGTMPTYDGTTPTKPESASHTYTFSGWDSEIELATADKDYTAQFSETIKTFAVSFGSNITVLVEGESITSGERLDYGTSVTISYSESLGYQKTSFKVNGDEQENNYSILVTEQITVEYSESAINYTLTYNLDSGSLSGQKESYTIEDETFTLPTPTKQGYKFIGWSGTDIEGMTLDVTIEKGSTGNREYTANWQIKTFTVNIPENQDVYTLTYDNLTVEYGGDFVFKVDLTDAYSQSTIVVKANGEEIQKDGEYYTISNITQNVNVTIDGYKLNEYTVTFTENESAYQIDKTGDTVTHGGEYKFKIELKPAYSESEIVVKAGQDTLTLGEDGFYTIENVTQNTNVTIEGATINTYIIKWLNHDGSVLETDENVEYGTMPTYDGTTPTKPESASHTYTFSGWDSEIELATSDKEYRAQFSETIKTFAVNFGSNITVLVEGEPITSGERLDYGTSVTISYSESLGYQKTSFKVNDEEQENNYSIQVTEQITVEYSESAINYTLTYNLDSGSLSGQKESYTIEDETFTLPIPTKQGYKFLGWSGTDLEQVTETVTIEKGSTGDRSYTANWQILQFTYSFYNGEILLKTETVDYGSAIVQPDKTPTKDSIDGINYVFSGWDPEVPATISDQNLTFYAQFKEETFTSGLNFTYSAFDDAYIVDIGSVQDATITVPATYNNKNVVEVKTEGFANNNTLNSITFEGNITTIGKSAFANCPNLNSIKGLDNITSIPQSAFEGDTSLTEFDIGDKVLAIGERAFANSGLTTVNIPSSVVAIENGAFDGCQITAFTADEDNANYATNGDGNLYNKNFTEIILYAQGNSQTTFVVPDSVTTLKAGAFTSLESQNLSKKKSLSDTTLLAESKLQNIVIGENVVTIEDNALPSDIIVFSYSASSLDGWSENLLNQNEIYYQGAWEMQSGEPIVTLSASEFKTGIYTNWQSYIDDNVRFLDVVTPGSHDAGTQTITAVNLHTQASDFYSQLIGGVRYFDMRVAEFNGQVRCIHANSSQEISNDNGTGLIFEDVLNDMLRFINENPSEILILDFQHLWGDFETNVIPLIQKILPESHFLKKSQYANLSTVTMGELRSHNINYIIIVQNDSKELNGLSQINFDSYDWIYKRTEVLRSQYDGDIHHDSADDLINHWEVYFNNFEEGKIFILQSQLTAQNITAGINYEKNLIEREKSIRNKGNNYVRSLSLEKNQDKLNKLNIVMRDFVVDDLDGVDSAKVSIQSILFLNVYKGNISADKLNYYKILLDFESVDNLNKSY